LPPSSLIDKLPLSPSILLSKAIIVRFSAAKLYWLLIFLFDFYFPDKTAGRTPLLLGPGLPAGRLE
jgi:hypothetical protein